MDKRPMPIDGWLGRLASDMEFDARLVQSQYITWISNTFNRVIIPAINVLLKSQLPLLTFVIEAPR